MKEILDLEEIELQPQRNSIFSSNFLRKVLLGEVLLFGIIAFLRINLIISTIQLGELRELVNVLDYENGWTFILLILLIASNIFLLNKKFTPILWTVKLGGFLSILGLTELIHWEINWLIFILIIYYCFRRIWSQFKIKQPYLIFYFFLSFTFVIFFILLEEKFGLINY